MFESYGIINYTGFLLAGILLNITPGSDTLYITAHSLSRGVRAGILSAIGISTGGLVHTLAAGLGLSVILTRSATAFTCVKYIGAIYLIYLGIKAFQREEAANKQTPEGGVVNRKYAEIYFSGVVTNVLNPKVALFFLAFLPQFISPGPQADVTAFLILGVTFITTGTLWGLFLACFASFMKNRVIGNSCGSVLQKVSGTIFIFLGITLAFSKR